MNARGVRIAFIILLFPVCIGLNPAFGGHLTVGHEGERVEALQDQLADLGIFDFPSTGFYGEITRKSVEEFQKAANLVPDGIVGRETRAALEIAEGKMDYFPRLAIYTHGPEVIYLQRMLYGLGYLPVQPTGYFRSMTDRAVREFQRDFGLRVDGIVYHRTWQALRKLYMARQVSAREKDLLAKIIYAESRGESFIGQVAVGAVVLNRVASPLFPNSIEDVITQPGQFEPKRTGDLGGVNDESYKAARRALQGEDPTYGALYFYSPSILKERGRGDRISWFEQETRPTAEIGTHIFAIPAD